jgi:hypothetical protein
LLVVEQEVALPILEEVKVAVALEDIVLQRVLLLLQVQHTP